MSSSALFLQSCVAPAIGEGTQPIYGGAAANPPADAMPTHLDGELHGEQVSTLLHLQFPQSYDAIKNRLGLPTYRDEFADYYQLPNGRWVKVAYQGTTAIGFQFGDD